MSQKIDYKQIPSPTINKAIYGKGGLLERVNDVLNADKHSIRKCAEILGYSTQSVREFLHGSKKGNSVPKATTIFEYARKLGVE